MAAKIYLLDGWRYTDGNASFDADLYVRFKDAIPVAARTYGELSQNTNEEILSKALAIAAYRTKTLTLNFNQTLHLGQMRHAGFEVEFIYDTLSDEVVNVRYFGSSTGSFQVQNFSLERDLIQDCPYVGRDYSGPDLLPAALYLPTTYRWIQLKIRL